jgi:hypothetical protein
VSESPNTITTKSRSIVVRAFVGPLPVYSESTRTAAFEIAALTLPFPGLC